MYYTSTSILDTVTVDIVLLILISITSIIATSKSFNIDKSYTRVMFPGKFVLKIITKNLCNLDEY